MQLAPDTIVELKYTGKRIPFKFENEKMKCKSLFWENRGDTVKCEYQDALVLTVGSGNDFKIVNQEISSKPIRVETQHRQPIEEKQEEEDVPYLSGDGVDGKEAIVIPEVPKRGRPRRKDVAIEA